MSELKPCPYLELIPIITDKVADELALRSHSPEQHIDYLYAITLFRLELLRAVESLNQRTTEAKGEE